MFWYYDDEGNIYENRVDAKNSGKKCTFSFFEKELSQINWDYNPPESLQELYKQRAQQIRSQYDHVVLCYSGGIDSTNVLETFYYNNIQIDEIMMMGPFSQDSYKGSDEYHNGTLYLNAFPILSTMNLPNTKISVIDYTKLWHNLNDFTMLQKYGENYYKYLGAKVSVHHMFWYDLDKFLNNKKRTAYIFGKEKPHLRYDDILNKYYAYFTDSCFMNYGNRYVFDNAKRVNFYTDPKFPNIMLKQYRKIIERHKETGDDIFNDYDNKIKSIIYDLKNPLVYESEKTKTFLLAKRDEYLLKKQNSDIFDFYKRSLNKQYQETKTLKNFTFFSKYYYINA